MFLTTGKVIKPRLYYNPDRIKKNGDAALYLRVIIDRKRKDFKLNIDWPVSLINLKNGILMPRAKDDKDVLGYNLGIEQRKAIFNQIQVDYFVRKETLTLEKLLRDVKIYDTKECFVSYMEMERNRRYLRKEIEKKTFQNANAAKLLCIEYDKLCLFKDINERWMKGFKSFLQSKGYMASSVWSTIKIVKSYLRLASSEVQIYVDQGAINFPNPEPKTRIVYLNEEELRRLIILLDYDLTDVQRRVLEAFLFSCFTSLRISDVFVANSLWEVQEGFLDFIPHKTRKSGKKLRIPLLPIARALINKGPTYFKLPNLVQYNESLKELADKAAINKNLTSHVGRHTFGYLYMTKTQNIYGLQEILGHTKITTTQKYSHLDDDYKMESTMKIQDGFRDLMRRVER